MRSRGGTTGRRGWNLRGTTGSRSCSRATRCGASVRRGRSGRPTACSPSMSPSAGRCRGTLAGVQRDGGGPRARPPIRWPPPETLLPRLHRELEPEDGPPPDRSGVWVGVAAGHGRRSWSPAASQHPPVPARRRSRGGGTTCCGKRSSCPSAPTRTRRCWTASEKTQTAPISAALGSGRGSLLPGRGTTCRPCRPESVYGALALGSERRRDHLRGILLPRSRHDGRPRSVRSIPASTACSSRSSERAR